MVAIAPFRALRYDAAQVDLQAVTSPPNDIIPPDERDQYAREAHNIVHAILPTAHDGDAEYPESPNPYERARDVLAQWQEEGVLARDDKPAFYLYEVHHGGPDGAAGSGSDGEDRADGKAADRTANTAGSAPSSPAHSTANRTADSPAIQPPRRTMRGFFCRIGLDPTYQHIKRHERTLPKKKADRLFLKTATQCDTEPIWLLYRDERGWVDEILTSNAFDELARVTDDAGDEHVLWRVDRPEAVTEIVAQFEDRDVVIADGHHRYQTALDHFAATGREEDASMLVCLVRDTDPGLRIEPTHRLVFDVGFTDLATALHKADDHWTALPLDLPDGDAEAQGRFLRHAVDGTPMGCVLLGQGPSGLEAYLLTLRPAALVDEGRGRLDTLHVTRVHERLLEPWGVTTDQAEDHLRYTRTAAEAVEAVASGQFPFAVMLSGEDVDAVLDVASQGHVMPQKSTYFVPKLRSGLVLSPLDEPRPRDWREIGGDGGRREFRMPALD